MWVLFEHTYSGSQGLFPAGQKFDLNAGILELISDDFYKKTCPPWEEHTNKDSVALGALRQKFLKLQGQANSLTDLANSATNKTKQLVVEFEAKRSSHETVDVELKKAVEDSRAAIEKAKQSKATEGDKKRAKKLSHTVQTLIAQEHKLNFELMKAESLLQASVADGSLTAIAAKEAKAAADAAYAEVEKLALKIAGKETKAQAKAEAKTKAQDESEQAETQEQANGQGETATPPEADKTDTESKTQDAADTGGQAAQTGQDSQPVPDEVKKPDSKPRP